MGKLYKLGGTSINTYSQFHSQNKKFPNQELENCQSSHGQQGATAAVKMVGTISEWQATTCNTNLAADIITGL